MEATRGTLILLRLLTERPMTQRELLDALQDEGPKRDNRTLRRWLEALREAGFDLQRKDGRYELRDSPVRLPLDRYEALATLNILASFAAREPVYGRFLDSGPSPNSATPYPKNRSASPTAAASSSPSAPPVIPPKTRR